MEYALGQVEEIMSEQDKVDLVRSLLEKDENETLDFKESYPLNKPSERKDIAKDLCAFANTKGGHIVVGIEDGTWKRVGIDLEEFNKDTIHQIASTLIIPHIPISIDVVPYEDLHYGLISIEKTHLVHYLQDKSAYIRDNSSNIRADPQTITRLTLESARWFQLQVQNTPDTSLIDLGKELPNTIDEVFERYIRKMFPDRLLDNLSGVRI